MEITDIKTKGSFYPIFSTDSAKFGNLATVSISLLNSAYPETPRFLPGIFHKNKKFTCSKKLQ